MSGAAPGFARRWGRGEGTLWLASNELEVLSRTLREAFRCLFGCTLLAGRGDGVLLEARVSQ